MVEMKPGMNTGKYHEITVAFGNGTISFQVLPVFIPLWVLPESL